MGSEQNPGPHIVLPNPGLIRCSGSGCSGLWEDVPKGAVAVYPAQVTLEIRNTTVPVLVARYDGSVSIHDIQAAINARYGAWALAESPTSEQKMWRVMPKKLAISLDVGPSGTKQVYYFSIQDRRAKEALSSDQPAGESGKK
jgi:hypothetical protein